MWFIISLANFLLFTFQSTISNFFQSISNRGVSLIQVLKIQFCQPTVSHEGGVGAQLLQSVCWVVEFATSRLRQKGIDTHAVC